MFNRNLVWQESPGLILFSLFLLILGIYIRSKVLTGLGLFFIFFLLYFHRNPKRTPPKQLQNHNELLLAPSDGKILSISDSGGSKGLKHIAIFLSPLDVHLQYAPCKCKVIKQSYKPGTFHPAFLFEKSQHNERMVHTLRTDSCNMYLVQIAGMVARRIVNFCCPGKKLKEGDPVGMIKFSSRVDLFVPSDKVKLICKEGDRVVGAETIIGYLT